MLARWFVTLQGFDMTVQHCPGDLNTVADAMSREPFVRDPKTEHSIAFLCHADAKSDDSFYHAAWKATLRREPSSLKTGRPNA